LRVAFRDSLGIAKITQANSYGIWGEDLPTLSYSKQSWKADNFKFTGKESLQGTGFIDFGARWYDNIVPRFTTIDPLSELSRRFSPFVYGNNNPLRFIDPDGMSSVGADGLTTEQWVENQGDEEKNKQSREDNKDKDKNKKKDEETKKKLPTTRQYIQTNGLNPHGDGINQDLTIEGFFLWGKALKPVGSLFGRLWGRAFGKVPTSIWDDIVATQGNYPGSVLPKSFELTTSEGIKIWVHGNATEHIAEFLQMKAINSTPEVVRLVTQIELQSLQGAVNLAIKNGIPYNQLITIGGWELKFVAPRAADQLPALIHALPK
jgi:RHS repeat-associated protein